MSDTHGFEALQSLSSTPAQAPVEPQIDKDGRESRSPPGAPAAIRARA